MKIFFKDTKKLTMVHHTDVVVDIYNVRIHFIFLPEKHTEQNDHTSTQPAVNTHSTKWPHTYNLLSKHIMKWPHTHSLLSRQQGIVTYDYITKYTTCCQHHIYLLSTWEMIMPTQPAPSLSSCPCVPLVEFMYLAFTCTPFESKGSDSGLCCCVCVMAFEC